MPSHKKTRDSHYSVFINDQRATILVELLTAVIITAIVLWAAMYFFVGNLNVMTSGKAKLELQRAGSLALERIAKDIREGYRVYRSCDPDPCNPCTPNPCDPKTDPSTLGNRTGFGLEGPEAHSDKIYILNYCASESCTYTKYFREDQKLKQNTTSANTVPWDIPDDITCDSPSDLDFERNGNIITVKFHLKKIVNPELGNEVDMWFSSSVRLPG